MTPHYLRYDSYGVHVIEGLAVVYYSFAPDALDLRHPQLSLN
jgi:hypothetical protein